MKLGGPPYAANDQGLARQSPRRHAAACYRLQTNNKEEPHNLFILALTHYIEMPKGIPIARAANVSRATDEARRVLLKTKDWTQTREHVRGWIKANYALSRTTVADYLDDIYFRLQKDAETRELLN